MKQIIQNLKTGETTLEDIPVPLVSKGHLLIKTHRSLVSLGTEKMLVQFGRSSLISKARQQPEKVQLVLSKIKTDGLLPTIQSVLNKLDEPLPLGYCNAGEVLEVGEGVSDFKVGDRVISNGPHAEFILSPQNLTAKIPDNVSNEEACFTVISSIGLQGIRLAEPTFGEAFVVIGLGLIGLLTIQLLKANGCEVIGFDFDDEKIKVAESLGFKAYNSSLHDPVQIVNNFTNEIGADAVIITASTKSNDVISQSAQMSRKRGRIILIGVIGLEINRNEFYKKELTFKVSCSYGPGRYDEDYEHKGKDYPIAFVRWTENRNFQAILSALSNKKLNVLPLITERVPLKDYNKIYNNFNSSSIASILEYEHDFKINLRPESFRSPGINLLTNQQRPNTIQLEEKNFSNKLLNIGIIGAGNFTKMTLLPSLPKGLANFKYIASLGGISSKILGKKYKFQYATTDYKEILNDSEVDMVLITTRHDLHSSLLIESINCGKSVFVEKPLALNKESLQEIIAAYKNRKTGTTIDVGYNRRFSPYILKAKSLLGNSDTPINLICTMNAGYIPQDSWVHDLQIGGGRIIGEACHFIDLMIYLTGSLVTSVFMSGLGNNVELNTDNAILTLNFENGSQGVINYFSNGSKSYSKERVEIFSQGKTIVIDNFKKIETYGYKNNFSLKRGLDKGHNTQFRELLTPSRLPLIAFEELINSSLTSLCAIESLKAKKKVEIIL